MKHASSLCAPEHQKRLQNHFPASRPLQKLIDLLQSMGGTPVLVGGSVRDHLLGLLPHDIDIEVYGLKKMELERALEQHFLVYAVGKTFGIYKVKVQVGDEEASFDVALPRLENKSGQGHRGFVVEVDHALDFTKAASRRDFTINAMGIDPVHQVLLDPYGGERDLQKRRLAHVSEAFVEDPLRVLRAAQFAARFELEIAPETLLLCQALQNELPTLSEERIFGEMKKLFFAKRPSLGLSLLEQARALVLFPELFALIGCPQDPEWHPEGDVWVHTLMVTDQAAHIICTNNLSEDEGLMVMTGALCHDLGKPSTTALEEGRIKSKGHEQAGEAPTRSLLARMGFPQRLTEPVVCFVKEHLKPHQLYSKRHEVTDSAIRRLASRVNISLLVLISQADFLGRTTPDAQSGHDPSAQWLLDKATALLGEARAPIAILLGRHLIARNIPPGPGMGQILHEAFEAQLDGAFGNLEEALVWLDQHLGTKV